MKLKPCPFCGKEDKLSITEFHRRAKAVRCGNCEATGPMTTTKPAAFTLWNFRAELPEESPNQALKLPEFTHEELLAMWHVLPVEGRWSTLERAYEKLDAYAKLAHKLAGT